MRTFTSLLAATLVLASGVIAQSPPIPPMGMYCCPPTGPGGLALDRQQMNPYSIFCYYDEGTDNGCFYNPATGAGGGPAAGCPTQAPSNPHPPSCPV